MSSKLHLAQVAELRLELPDNGRLSTEIDNLALELLQVSAIVSIDTVAADLAMLQAPIPEALYAELT